MILPNTVLPVLQNDIPRYLEGPIAAFGQVSPTARQSDKDGFATG